MNVKTDQQNSSQNNINKNVINKRREIKFNFINTESYLRDQFYAHKIKHIPIKNLQFLIKNTKIIYRNKVDGCS